MFIKIMLGKCDLHVGGENSLQISSHACVAPILKPLSPYQTQPDFA